MGRRFKSPSFQTLIKSNSAVVIAVDLRICGSLRFRRACGVRLDSNTAGSAVVRSSVCLRWEKNWSWTSYCRCTAQQRQPHVQARPVLFPLHHVWICWCTSLLPLHQRTNASRPGTYTQFYHTTWQQRPSPHKGGQTQRRVRIRRKSVGRSANLRSGYVARHGFAWLTLSAAQRSCDGYQPSLWEARAPLV